VEVVFPVETPDHIHHLRKNVLEAYLHDNLRARIMHADGTYHRLTPKDGKNKLDVQEWLMERTYNKKA
jgi:polyphosphate kinase